MRRFFPAFLVLLACILVFQPLATAQVAPTRDSRDYAHERHMIETALSTVVSVIQRITLPQADQDLSDQLRGMAFNLNSATNSFASGLAGPAPASPPVSSLSADDLRMLANLLESLQDQVRDIRAELDVETQATTDAAFADLIVGLDDALRITRRLMDTQDTPSRDEPWLQPGRYDEGRKVGGDERAERSSRWTDEDEWEHIRERYRARRDERERQSERYRGTLGEPSDIGIWIGEFSNRWPYQETALYRRTPAIRYNRVEGLVLGIQRRPLTWDSWERGRIFGQVGYAFGLEDLRYEIGAETRIGDRYDANNDIKFGGSYHKNTATNDLWKSSWAENSLASFFFKNDFFDYYETEGWTVYSVARLGNSVQVSAGYRSDAYRSLDRTTTWSLFGGDGFRRNPGIDGLTSEADINSVVLALEGGSVQGLHSLPRGGAFRLEAEIADGMGGDYDFSRFLADTRLYLPVSRDGSLSLRVRAGLSTGDSVPFVKQFTLGGIGSVRAYPQNIFAGTHVLLGNVEYSMYQISIFDDWLNDLLVSGFFDAGWVGRDGFDTFDVDDVIPSAGIGLGFADRTVRLELAWPLREVGGLDDRRPTLWLRINPPF